MGNRMGAYRTLLTHLSQRYSKEPSRFVAPVAPASASAPPTAAAAYGSGPRAAAPDGGANGSDGCLGGSDGTREGVGGGNSLLAFDSMVLNLADLPSMPVHMGTLSRFFEAEASLKLAAEVTAVRRPRPTAP